MTQFRTILSLAAVAVVSACSYMPDVSMPDLGSANTTASQRENYIYGEERTASHPPAPAPVMVSAPVPAPAPAPVPAPVPTPAPVTSAEPMVDTHTQK